MRKTLTTVALMLALGTVAVAGEMSTPPVAPPNSTQERSADSDTVAVIQAVLDVIVSVLP